MKLIPTSLVTFVLTATAFGASLSGTWKMTANGPDGNVYKFDLVIKEDSGKLAGNVVSERGNIPLQEVTAKADELSFIMPYEIGPINFKLKQTGNALKGLLIIPDGNTGSVEGVKADDTAAVATGNWKVVAKDSEGNESRSTLELKQDGEKLTGQLVTENGDIVPISEGKVTGSEVSFKIMLDDGAIAVTGKIEGNTVKGTYKMPSGVTGTYSGTKS